MLSPCEVRAQRNLILDAIELFVVVRDGGDIFVAEPVTMSPVTATDIPAATLALRPEYAQVLMDELWRCGVRPQDAGSAGELAATQYHLEDLRRLVFKEE